ncbi:unnamed protein product [Clonostachys rosea]|uniref:SWR1-complex protein 3 domain-containing protein n=1 Tax=Bionectria ochroleuca TaxID=29856 RepID=A0ABY6UWK1_BIOOC|nr:unnamed protein product [Clonostachys rosea]
MEKKRKLPPRAAARVESAAKRRHSTPRSETPAPVQPPVEDPVPSQSPPTPPPSLPNSVQAGKPLPTVEDAQSDDLSSKEYQSVGESGVLTESLSRSRQKWTHEGLFEKYWTKPHKRKGVVHEDPKNPPKDSMSKVGVVTITIEPHVVEATMYVVKDPKPRLPQNQQQQQQPLPPNRPIIQYGPPNGTMPSPKPVAASPAPEPAAARPVASPAIQKAAPTSPAPSNSHVQVPVVPTNPAAPPPAPTTNNNPAPAPAPAGPSYPPRPQPPPTTPARTAPPAQPTPAVGQAATPSYPPRTPTQSTPAQAMAPPAATPMAAPRPPTTAHPAPAQSPGLNKPPTAPPPAAKPAANDPVIALLAQKASGDVELRDLMKRVAVGQAKEGELAHFQKIIDQLNAEYKRNGGQQGPSADRLLVDGRTVKYFAEEVRAILDIVLASNPQQKSTDLRPPPRSDPLVVLLVKEALDIAKTRDIIRRIAEGRPGYTDSTDLRDILDKLHKSMKVLPRNPPATPQARQPAPAPAPNGLTPNGGQVRGLTAHSAAHPNAQTLRSKGPAPAPKPDISAVVFDFGTGDRYRFPKFSILEYLPTSPGQQVVASFLIVRKGSISEYGSDPDLDYYQPITVRLYASTGRHLENLARVVAPQDEVRRYMDDVMDNMTRAEYVLLAMRLPHAPKDGDKELNGNCSNEESKTAGSTPQAADTDQEQSVGPDKPSVLWAPAALKKGSASRRLKKYRDHDDEAQLQYQKLIGSVAAKESEAE